MPRGVYERKRTEARSAARGPNPVAAPGRGEVSAPAACERCRYFRLPSGPIGECRRYPAVHRKAPRDFCGEFQPPPLL